MAFLLKFKHSPLFSSFLWRALSISLIIHFLALVLFTIHTPLPDSSWPLPPAQVQIDAEVATHVILHADINPHGLLAYDLEKPPQRELSSLSLNHKAIEQDHTVESPSAPLNLTSAEIDLLRKPLSSPLSPLSIKMNWGAELDGYDLTKNSIKKMIAILEKTFVAKAYSLVYSISIEETTGRVLKIQEEKECSEALINTLGREILQTISFYPKDADNDPSSSITRGQIELLLTPGQIRHKLSIGNFTTYSPLQGVDLR